MTVYQWSVEFLLPGVPLSRPLTLGSIALRPMPRDENSASRSVGCLQLETGQHLDERAVAAQALSQVELLAMAAAALGGSVRQPVVTSIRLDNRHELDAAGMRTPIENGRILMTWNVISPDIDETALTRGYQRAIALQSNVLPLWLRVARWLWKGNSDADPYDEFLALWISFNVLYGPFVQKSERLGIEAYLAQALPTEPDAEALLREVIPGDICTLGASGLPLRTPKGPRPIANELQAALGLPAAQQSRRGLVTLAFLVIYAVRCAIVHEGGVALPQDSELRIVSASIHVLKSAIMHLLRNLLGV